MSDSLASESEVRYYSRVFPEIFDTACGPFLKCKDGRQYFDFLSGCGALNYGHNPNFLKSKLIEYIQNDGVAMSLDMATVARRDFMDAFHEHILKPRNLNYKMMFPGPTGASAVEAALRIARNVTQRPNIIAFTNAFHGCTAGALSLTGSSHHRGSWAGLNASVTRMPFDGYLGQDIDTAFALRKLLNDPSSGVDLPAAIVLETVQAEGGINCASLEWLRSIAELSVDIGALLIVDDIQVGCGRTGNFFSFEEAGLKPDIVTLSKSLSGFGLPLSMVLVRPEFDVLKPGEHNGTFRGNSHAFITARAAIDEFWRTADFSTAIENKSLLLKGHLEKIATRFNMSVVGKGLIQGLKTGNPGFAKKMQHNCFQDGLLLELCGPKDDVIKILPPLTISAQQMADGISIVETVLGEALEAVH